MEMVLAAAEGWGAAVWDGDIATQREVLTALVEQVVPARVRRGTYGVEIDWTPLGEALGAALDAPLSTAMSQAA